MTRNRTPPRLRLGGAATPSPWDSHAPCSTSHIAQLSFHLLASQAEDQGTDARLPQTRFCQAIELHSVVVRL